MKWMKHVYILLIIFCMSVYGEDIVVSSGEDSISVLQNSKIYIDDEHQRISDIVKLASFKEINKTYLNLSITEDVVWLDFSLTNNTSAPIEKLLVMDNAFLLELSLFEVVGSTIKEVSFKRKTLAPSILLTLSPKSSKRFYMRVKGHSALKFALTLENKTTYLEKDRINQIINIMLLATIMTLLVYTLTLYFMIWDSSYFYYAVYLFCVLYLEISYIGLGAIYLPESYTAIDQYTLVQKVSFIVISYSLFFNTFLQLKSLKFFYRGNLIFITLAILLIVLTVVPYVWRAKIDLLMATVFLLFNFIASIVRYRSGFKEARFFIWGVGVVVLTYILMIFEALGWISVIHHVPNILIYATSIEAMILSLAFVDRYLILQKQKEQSDYRLLMEARNREQLIQKEVDQKTDALQKAVDLQEVLFKELHHRVKNNLQLILSITRLQKEQLVDDACKASFATLESRIGTISQTHNLIYLSKDIEHVNMYDYVTKLTKGLKVGDIDDKITFHYDIEATMPLEKAVTIGLIINELVSNALKYAFDDKDGEINITLKPDYLEIQDNGKGFDKEDISKDSLGLQLVESLVKSQLKGTIVCKNDNGTTYEIIF